MDLIDKLDRFIDEGFLSKKMDTMKKDLKKYTDPKKDPKKKKPKGMWARKMANMQESNMVGWIAIYNRKKIEIKKSEAKDLWDAKQLAIKKLKVPKSKQGLLAIDVAYDD
jgi:hypothetical protein